MAWTSLTFAFGSLLTSTKMTQLYDNITAAFNKDSGAPVLANGYIVTAMFGSASVDQATIGASAVGQGELKTATGEVSTTTTSPGQLLILPGGEYGFYPQLKDSASSAATAHLHSTGGMPISYVTIITLAAFSGTTYAQQRYVQASPPYQIGGMLWGHFLFLLRKVTTGEVISAYEAEDPPWAYNGKIWLPKDHTDRIAAVPHPFADYWQRDPVTDGLEVVIVNLNAVNTVKWRADNQKIGKGILEDLGSVIKGKGTSKTFADYVIPTIPKFTDRVKVIEP